MENKYLPEDNLNDKKVVTQSNYLIESSYKLKTLEQKVFLILISQIQPSDQDFTSYYFRVKDFADFLNVSSSNLYKELLNNTESIMKRLIRIKNKVTGDVVLTHWVQKAVYYKKKGMLEVQFDAGLKPYLLNLKNQFVSYSIKNIKELKSFYSIRIYELLKQYQKIGIRNFSIEGFKEILAINKNEYELYGHLKNKVILRAQREIKEKTDIYFELDEKKEGRKVTHLVFHIYHNSQYKQDKESQKSVLVKGILNIDDFLSISIGFTEKEKQAILEKYPAQIILDLASQFKTKVNKSSENRKNFLQELDEKSSQVDIFLEDDIYKELEEKAKKNTDYEQRKIHYLMKIMDLYEKVKNEEIILFNALTELE